jgi:ribosomal protein L37AE/L43A
MIDVEEFRNLVKSSTNYTSRGVVYLALDDSEMACPFCGRYVHMKNGLIQCDCVDSIKFSMAYQEQQDIIKNANEKIRKLQSEEEKESLKFFKNYFERKMVPVLREEFEKGIEGIRKL